MANPAPQSIVVSLSGDAPLSNLSCEITPSSPYFAGLFASECSAAGVSVGIYAGKLAALETANVAKPYTATLKLTSTQAGNSPEVTLVVSETAPTPFSLGASSMTFTAGQNSGPINQTLQVLSTNSQTQWSAGVTTSDGKTWLSVSPVTGQGSGTVTVMAYPAAASLTSGTYYGTVTVTPAGMAAVSASVTLTVGASGSLSLSPGSMSFVYPKPVAGGLPDPQVLQISSSSTTTLTISQGASSSWLLIGGTTSVSKDVAPAAPATVNISVNPPDASISASYSGSIVISAGDGSVASVPVTLSVNAGAATVTVNPTSLDFTSPVGVTPAAKAVIISTTAASTAFTAQSGATWLTVGTGAAAGSAYAVGTTQVSNPATLMVYVNPTNLQAGPHASTITIAAGGVNYYVAVSYYVGGSGGISGPLVAAPSQLNFSMQTGGTAPAEQQFSVSGTAGTVFTLSRNQTWLNAVANSETVPTTVTVGINSEAPTIAGTYEGIVTVASTAETRYVTVRLTVSSEAVLIAAPGSIVVNYDPDAPAGTNRYHYINVTSSGGASAPIQYMAASNATWLQLFGTGPGQSASGTTPGQFAVAINPATLSAGASTGSIQVGGITIPVTVIVAGTGGNDGTGTGPLTISPSPLSFSTAAGSSPDTQTVRVTSATLTQVTISTSTVDGGTWLRATPGLIFPQNSAPASVSVTVDGSALTAGAYTGSINFSVNGTIQTVNVTVTVSAAALTTLSVENLASFDYQIGGTLPGTQTIQVSSPGGAIAYTVTRSTTSGGNWLSATPAQGNTPGPVQVSVNPQGLAAGTYSGAISISSASASNSPVTRTVTLVVREAATLSASPASLAFSYHSDGGPVPAPQTVSVNSSGAPLNVTATSNANWLSVTPETGITPASLSLAVNPAGMTPGRYTGQVNVTSGGRSVTLEVAFTVTAPLPTITRVVSSASYKDGPLAGGQIIAIFGEFIGPEPPATQELDENGKVATTLGGVRVMFSGYPAALTFVSSKQAKAIVPYAIAKRTGAAVWVQYQGLRSNAMQIDLAPSAPGILTLDESGIGQGIVSNQDGTANSESNAAARGTTVTINITGEGETDPAGVDGRMHSNDSLPKAVLPVAVLINGQPARVVDYSGTPNLVSGNSRIIVEVPLTSATGKVPVVVQVGTASSQEGVILFVK